MTDKRNFSSKELPGFISDIPSMVNREQAKMMIAEWDRKGYYKSAWLSKNMEDQYGIRASGFNGKRLHEVYSLAEGGRMHSHVQKAIDSRRIVRLVSHITTQRGNFWQDTTFIPSTNLDRSQNVIGIIYDITTIREKESQLQEEFKYIGLLNQRCP